VIDTGLATSLILPRTPQPADGRRPPSPHRTGAFYREKRKRSFCGATEPGTVLGWVGERTPTRKPSSNGTSSRLPGPSCSPRSSPPP